MSDLADTLSARQQNYGTFMDNARISNDLLDVLRATPGWANFQPDQRTATELICQKLARALSGNAQYDDNWRDIAGYAQLIVDRINGTGCYATLAIVGFDNTLERDGHDNPWRCKSCKAVLGDAHLADCPQLKNARDPGGSAGG